MTKVLAVCFLVTQHWRALPDHFLPFLPIFDHAGPPVVFQRTLQAIFMIGAFCLLLNYRVRTSSLVLGGVILVGILSSRTFFENNRAYTACLWLLAGLQVPGREPWPLRWQVIILYFGAGANKLLDPDWRSGQFFENMVVKLGKEPLYIRISSALPPLWLSFVMGWMVIIVEFILVAGFLVGDLWGLMAWTGIAYHTTLLITARNTFGMFYFATLSSFLAFVRWPLPPLRVSFEGTESDREKILGLIRRLDLDHLLVVDDSSTQDAGYVQIRKPIWRGLRLNKDDQAYQGASALYMLSVYNPVTYLAFAILLSVPFGSAFRIAWAVIFLLFMSPALLGPPLRGLRLALK